MEESVVGGIISRKSDRGDVGRGLCGHVGDGTKICPVAKIGDGTRAAKSNEGVVFAVDAVFGTSRV